MPKHLSEVPAILRTCTKASIVLAAASPVDAHGSFRLGTNADDVAPFIGRVPFFLEADACMPRTFGRNQLHVSRVAGWVEVERAPVEVPPAEPGERDRRIAAHVAARVPGGATIRVGIGDLGVHTGLLSDGVADLVRGGRRHRHREGAEPGQDRDAVRPRGPSPIRPRLTEGSAVTTLKNTVDMVVTEHGVAELRGRRVRERTRRLVAVADPRFRDELTAEARAMGDLSL